jgi:hypothetical protein
MDVIKRSLFALVMLLVVVVIWVGLYVYFEGSKVKINPNAETYKTQLKESFDLKGLDEVYERTQESLPVTPEVFLSLVDKD